MAEPEANPQQDTLKKPEAPANVPNIPDIDKIAQSAADRVRTEYSQKLRVAQDEIETLRKEKMTAKERADYEATQLKEELERKSKDLTRREMELLATHELEKQGLDIDFLDYVIGTDKDATLGKIAQLKQTFDTALGKAVESKMKAQGRDPNRGKTGTTPNAGFEGMTPKEIQEKSRKDPEWFRQNETAILKGYADGTLKKK